MSASLQPPELRRILADIERRLSALERRIQTRDEATDDAVMFSYAGTLQGGVTSPPAVARKGGTLVNLVIGLATPGTTATVLEVLRSGSVVRSVTIPAGATSHRAALDLPFGVDQETLQLRLASAGTGAANLSVEARFA